MIAIQSVWTGLEVNEQVAPNRMNHGRYYSEMHLSSIFVLQNMAYLIITCVWPVVWIGEGFWNKIMSLYFLSTLVLFVTDRQG